jgi:hypothetical protein
VVDDVIVTLTSHDIFLGFIASTTITVLGARVSSITIPTSIVGGNILTPTVTLDSPAAPGGDPVNFHSDNAALVIIPASMSIPAGQSSAVYAFFTQGVDNNTVVTFGASRDNAGQSQTFTLAKASLASATAQAPSITGGSADTINFNLDGKTGSSGRSITVTSDTPAVIPSPSTVSLGSQVAGGTVRIASNPVATQTTVNLAVTDGVTTVNTTVTVNPPVITYFSIAPSTVYGTQNMQATVAFSGPAPAGGLPFVIASYYALPMGILNYTLPAGHTYGYFTVATPSVDVALTGQMKAAAGDSASALLSATINPPILSAVQAQSTSIAGGTQSAAEVYLNFPAGPSGAVVTLSSDSANLIVAGSVAISANKLGGLFQFRVRPVNVNQTATISATYHGVTKTVTITISPF